MRLFRRKPKLDQQEIYDWLFRVFSFCDSEARTSALAWLKKTYPNSSDALRQTALLASCASLCNFMSEGHKKCARDMERLSKSVAGSTVQEVAS